MTGERVRFNLPTDVTVIRVRFNLPTDVTAVRVRFNWPYRRCR